jgi:hypothetical protein
MKMRGKFVQKTAEGDDVSGLSLYLIHHHQIIKDRPRGGRL